MELEDKPGLHESYQYFSRKTNIIFTSFFCDVKALFSEQDVIKEIYFSH